MHKGDNEHQRKHMTRTPTAAMLGSALKALHGTTAHGTARAPPPPSYARIRSSHAITDKHETRQKKEVNRANNTQNTTHDQNTQRGTLAAARAHRASVVLTVTAATFENQATTQQKSSP